MFVFACPPPSPREGLEESPVFRRLLPSRRCVVLLDGFFEWKLEGKDKRPYFVKDASGKPYLPLAGLYDVWVTGEVGEVFRFQMRPWRP